MGKYQGSIGIWDMKPRLPTDQGIKAHSKGGQFGQHWWAERWIAALENVIDAGRLRRGRSYARSGQVLSIEEGAGGVQARVLGSRKTPYKVSIRLGTLTDEQWERVLDEMSAQALYSAQLLAGEMPAQIEETFQAAGVALFPARDADLVTDCSCPDWADRCKHVAAAFYILAEQFDEDPFLLFRLRGRTQEQILEALRARRTGANGESDDVEEAPAAVAPVPRLEALLDTFWQAGERLEPFPIAIKPPVVSLPLLKRLGPPAFLPDQELARLLGPSYEAITREALAAAYAGNGDDHADDAPDAGEPDDLEPGKVTHMRLRYLLETYPLDTLQKLGALCGMAGLRQRKTAVDAIAEALLDRERLEGLWRQLDEASQDAVALALYSEGKFDEFVYEMRYDVLPPERSDLYYLWRREVNLIDLFLQRDEIPDEMMPLLEKWVPRPEPFRLHGLAGDATNMVLKSETGEIPLTLDSTEAVGPADLAAFLRLVDAGAVDVTARSHLPTGPSIAQILKVLIAGDFLERTEVPQATNVIRPVGLTEFSLGAGFVQPSGRLEGKGPLALTDAGRAWLRGRSPELLLEGLERWSAWDGFDELCRIPAIKGQSAAGAFLTRPATRRDAILEALSWCPAGEWLAVREFFRGLIVWELDFAVENGDRLYMGQSRSLSTLTPDNYWIIVKGFYIVAVIWDVLASIGALDVAYAPPGRLQWDPDSFQPAITLSPFDGLAGFRINPLGAYLLGHSAAYAAPARAPFLQASGDLIVRITTPELVVPADRLALDAICEPAGPDAYRLGLEPLLTLLAEGRDLEGLRLFLAGAHEGPLPAEVISLFDEALGRGQAFKAPAPALMIEARNRELAALALSDAKLRRLCRLAGDRTLVIDAGRERAVRKRLRELGYVLPAGAE